MRVHLVLLVVFALFAAPRAAHAHNRPTVTTTEGSQGPELPIITTTTGLQRHNAKMSSKIPSLDDSPEALVEKARDTREADWAEGKPTALTPDVPLVGGGSVRSATHTQAGVPVFGNGLIEHVIIKNTVETSHGLFFDKIKKTSTIERTTETSPGFVRGLFTPKTSIKHEPEVATRVYRSTNAATKAGVSGGIAACAESMIRNNKLSKTDKKQFVKNVITDTAKGGGTGFVLGHLMHKVPGLHTVFAASKFVGAGVTCYNEGITSPECVEAGSTSLISSTVTFAATAAVGIGAATVGAPVLLTAVASGVAVAVADKASTDIAAAVLSVSQS